MTTQRKLGDSGLTTPSLILGGNVFGWTADRAASFSVLDAFIAGGGRMIDTADVYSAWVPGNKGGQHVQGRTPADWPLSRLVRRWRNER